MSDSDLKKLNQAAVPAIVVTNPIVNNIDDAENLFHFIKHACDSFNDKTGCLAQISVIDMTDTNDKCKISEDGIHRIVQVENKVIKEPVIICVKCGQIFLKASEEEINKFTGLRVYND